MKIQLLSAIAVSALLISCNGGSKQETQQDSVSNADTTTVTEPTPPAGPSSFDVNKLPVSDKAIGDFPFFSLPEGLVIQNKKAVERKFDKLFFPLNGVMTPVEGRIWKADIIGDPENNQWSAAYFEKSYHEAITAAGGVKVHDAMVPDAELERIKDQATYFGEAGSIDYWNSPAKVYIIRRADGGDVYIQFYTNTVYGGLQILQQESFKQTITMLKSDEIKKQLDEKGKAVLHINFDTDKATLKPEGMDAVKEIIKVPQADQQMKIAINGYTDNSGNAEHNKKLSEARAETVKSELIKAGIDAKRLSAEGFGQDDPMADNSTEDGKALNRRVELVKE